MVRTDNPGTYGGGGNNFDFDPRFVDSSAGDYHLGLGSAATDLGSAVDAPDIDFEDTPRLQDSSQDIGADERISTPSGGPVLVTSKTLPQGEVGVGYGIRLEITGGQPPYNVGITPTVPSGLILIGHNIVGTPTAAGKWKLTVNVTDQLGAAPLVAAQRPVQSTVKDLFSA